MKTKTFDLESAKNGAKVVTRDGRPARIVCWDAKGIYPIVALVSGKNFELAQSYTEDGKYNVDCDKSIEDLLLVYENPELTEFEQKVCEVLNLCLNLDMVDEVKSAASSLLSIARKELQEEQKSAEWSEEDENMFACVIDDVKEINKTKKHKHQKEIGEMEIDWLKNRLKSLRSKSHWKPSEEQMDRLLSIVDALRKNCYYDTADFLASLYNDLKKLM